MNLRDMNDEAFPCFSFSCMMTISIFWYRQTEFQKAGNYNRGVFLHDSSYRLKGALRVTTWVVTE